MTKVARGPAGNRPLARPPEADLGRLLPLLKPIKLGFDEVIYEARGPMKFAHFRTGTVLSALTVMQDGNAIEVATVGNEGLVGHTVVAGGKTSPRRVAVQTADGGPRIEAKAPREFAGGGPLQDLPIEYQTAFMAQVSQSVACNGPHRLERRCCRWPLMTRDRISADDPRLTRQDPAIMLGPGRASVTETPRPPREAGLLRSHRGRISVLDRAGLEARSCECYRVVKAECDRFLGPSAG